LLQNSSGGDLDKLIEDECNSEKNQDSRNSNSRQDVEEDDQMRRFMAEVLPPSSLFPPNGMVEAELAFDIPFYTLQELSGGSLDDAIAHVEYEANVHDHFMSRDPMIRIVVPQTVVRMEKFYENTNIETIGNLLSALKAEWQTSELQDTPWDMVNTRKTYRNFGGGLAYTNTIGKDGAPFGVMALYHENGHNWGAQHRVYAKDTMDGNRPHHGPLNIERVLNRKRIEFDEGNLDAFEMTQYPDPLHPYAHVDIASTSVNLSTDIPVLANDWDANGDSISIRSFSSTTATGGTVIKKSANTLRYTPPTNYVGKDMIYYEVEDSTGLYNRELVHIEVINHGLAVQYDFEGTTPGIAHDSSGNDLTGRYVGTTSGGVIGSGVRLKGTLIADHRFLLPPGVLLSENEDDYPLDPYMTVGNAFDPMDESYTLSMWFRSEDVTGVHHVVSKDFLRDGSKYGFQFAITDSVLGFTMREFYGLAPDLSQQLGDVTRGEWYHLAMVIDRSTDYVYIYQDGRKYGQVSLIPGSFIFMGRGPLRFGYESKENISIDDIRVYTRALSPEEILSTGVQLGGKPAPYRDIYEAELAHYSGAVAKVSASGNTGSGWVDYSNDEVAYIEWTFDVADSGDYYVSFRYALDDSDGCSLNIMLDGYIIKSNLNLDDTGKWTTWAYSRRTSTTLNAGTHILRLTPKETIRPNVDHFLLQEILSDSNTSPRFTHGMIEMKAVPNTPFSGSLSSYALDWDRGDLLTFQKTSGPGWLSVSTDGTLLGTPGSSKEGINEFTVKVTDTNGKSARSMLKIDVQYLENGIINFNDHTVVSYTDSQDKDGIATVEDYGATLRLSGNTHKAIAFPYAVTANTVIEFDFRSSKEGDYHSIGLDENLSNSNKYKFKLYGTEDSSGVINDFDSYISAEPYYKHYVIPVGQFYHGEKTHFVFINDHDVSYPDSESVFTNLKIYEQTEPLTPSPTQSPTFKPPTSRPTSLLTVDPTVSPTGPPTQHPTSSPTQEPTPSPTQHPTLSPTNEPTPSPTHSPVSSPTLSPVSIDLTNFVQYTSDEQFFKSDSSVYFVTIDPLIGPTERVWWGELGESRETLHVPLSSTCLGPGNTVSASLKAQQEACGKTWQMNAGRARGECGHRLKLQLDDASRNPWLDHYNLQGCTFQNPNSPIPIIVRNWHDSDQEIGSMNLDFEFTLVPTLPLLEYIGDCSRSNVCGECQGDCDNDKHCNYGLVCAQRDELEEITSCAGAGQSGKDYCHLPETPNTLVIMGRYGDPHSAFPLGKCQGVCDNDLDCASGLLCMQRSGSEEVPGCIGTPPNRVDYCYDPNAGECTDYAGWFDSDGDGCSWYSEGETRCTDFGECCENEGHTAKQACCVCGGGSIS